MLCGRARACRRHPPATRPLDDWHSPGSPARSPAAAVVANKICSRRAPCRHARPGHCVPSPPPPCKLFRNFPNERARAFGSGVCSGAHKYVTKFERQPTPRITVEETTKDTKHPFLSKRLCTMFNIPRMRALAAKSPGQSQRQTPNDEYGTQKSRHTWLRHAHAAEMH